jgi:hypothetical protein
MKACRISAEKQKVHWVDRSWSGDVNPLLRVELATRADAYMALVETSFEQWKEINENSRPE